MSYPSDDDMKLTCCIQRYTGLTSPHTHGTLPLEDLTKFKLTFGMYYRVYIAEFSGITKDELSPMKHLTAWLERVTQRPAVQRGLNNYTKPE
jgi:glutathione S-transferase